MMNLEQLKRMEKGTTIITYLDQNNPISLAPHSPEIRNLVINSTIELHSNKSHHLHHVLT